MHHTQLQIKVEKQRLFFALMPPKEVVEQISQLLSSFKILNNSIKIVNNEKIHITLLFLGEVEAKSIVKIIKQVNKIKLNNFKLTLDQLGYFTKSKVYWLGLSEMAEELLQLEENIYNQLAKIPDIKLYDEINQKNKYTPHVTLLKKVQDNNDVVIPPKIPKIQWNIDKFYLLRSKSVNSKLEYEVVKVFGDESA